MKKYVPFILILGVTFFVSEELFSQVSKTGSKNPELFNEEGYIRGITMARAFGLVELALAICSMVFAVRAKKRSSL